MRRPEVSQKRKLSLLAGIILIFIIIIGDFAVGLVSSRAQTSVTPTITTGSNQSCITRTDGSQECHGLSSATILSGAQTATVTVTWAKQFKNAPIAVATIKGVPATLETGLQELPFSTASQTWTLFPTALNEFLSCTPSDSCLGRQWVDFVAPHSGYFSLIVGCGFNVQVISMTSTTGNEQMMLQAGSDGGGWNNVTQSQTSLAVGLNGNLLSSLITTGLNQGVELRIVAWGGDNLETIVFGTINLICVMKFLSVTITAVTNTITSAIFQVNSIVPVPNNFGISFNWDAESYTG